MEVMAGATEPALGATEDVADDGSVFAGGTIGSSTREARRPRASRAIVSGCAAGGGGEGGESMSAGGIKSGSAAESLPSSEGAFPIVVNWIFGGVAEHGMAISCRNDIDRVWYM